MTSPITVPFRRSPADIEAALVAIMQQTQIVLITAEADAFRQRATAPQSYAHIRAALASNTAALAVLGVEI